MKMNHFTIAFALIFLTYTALIELSNKEQISIAEHLENMDRYFQSAIDDGAGKLVTSENERLVVHKEQSAEAFFMSLYSSMGILDSPDKQELLREYLPVFAVTEESGFYVLYSDEYTDATGNKSFSKRWSEKIPYVYEDEDFVYNFTLEDNVILYDKNGILNTPGDIKVVSIDYHEMLANEKYENFRKIRPDNFMLDEVSYEQKKRDTIIGVLETYMNYYVNQHNRIAKQYGILYEFTMPVVDESEWVRSVIGPSIIVFFQGYPYEGTKETYHRFCVAGAQISKKTAYYVEDLGTYCIYHKYRCNHVLDETKVTTYYSKKESAKAGAYACPICFPNTGVHK